MLHHQLGGLRALLLLALFHLLRDAAIEQKVRLIGVAQHLQTGVLRGQRNAGEIHVRGDVLQAHIDQRIEIHLVRAMAHQRAHVALRMEELALGKTVVDEDRRAALQSIGNRADEGLALRLQLGQIVLRAGHVDGWTQIGRLVHPGKTAVVGQHHAALVPHAVLLAALSEDQLHRHGVEHLVADDDAFDGFRQLVGPCNLIAELLQRLLLARAQAARQIDDGVALDAAAQRVEQLLGECARARAEFPDLIRARCVQRLAHLLRQRPAEQRRELGRGHEVAARLRHGAELGRAVGVITEARRVQRQLHEAIERQPATRRANGLFDVLLERRR